MSQQSPRLQKRILLIENPQSGQSATDTSCLRQTCLDAGWELVQRPLNQDCSFNELLKDAQDFDAVVGIGGDGTISGLAAELCNTGIPLLAWPGGTGNLIAQNLYPDLKPETLCKALIDWQVCELDMGEMQAQDLTQRFVMLAGAGTDARMIRDSEELKPNWGMVAYVKALLSQFNQEPSQIKLTIDDQLIPEEQACGVLVANLGKLNLAMPIGDEIQGQDALLDVIVVRQLSPSLLMQEVWNAARRRFGASAEPHADIGIYQGRQIELTAEPSLPLQYDGEPLEQRTPVSFKILPGVLKMFGYPQALATVSEMQTEQVA